MRIAIYGASVSAQSVRQDTGRPVGYAEFLRREHMGELGASAIVQFAYSGSRLADGGMVRLIEVVNYRPDICIIEPIVEDRSRGLAATREDYAFVYGQMIEAGILPITLLLPWPEENKELRAYELVTALCRDWSLPTIEFELPGDLPTAEHFIGVHTTEMGGRLYANEIAKRIKAIGDPKAALIKAQARWNPSESRLSAAKITVPERKSFRRIVLDVRTKATEPVSFRLLQFQNIGTFSPVFKVSTHDTARYPLNEPLILSAWDPYCHYERPSYVLLGVGSSAAPHFRIGVEVIGQAPEYGKVRRPVEAWPALADLQFRPRGPLYLITNAKAELRLVDYA